MRPRDIHLVTAVLVLSVAVIVENEIRLAGHLGFTAGRVAVYLAIAVNAAIAFLGLFGPHRIAWLAYLIVSAVGTVLIGAATPIVALYLLWATHLCGFC
jgi:hypothetical protein